MEFLRFGSQIPGSYWGCCAACIIQNFKVDPDAPASIQIVHGDSGAPLGDKFVGKTWRDIFWHRLRFGTFSTENMPNHAFFAILASSQVSGGVGRKWLEILKEAGFEFLRAVDNSVYTGSSTSKKITKSAYSHTNYIFGLFRNVGGAPIVNQFQPPQSWIDLDSKHGKLAVEPNRIEGDDGVLSTASAFKEQLERYNKLPEAKWYTEKQLEDEGVPVWLAGVRSTKQQRKKKTTPPKTKQPETPPAPAAAIFPEVLTTD